MRAKERERLSLDDYIMQRRVKEGREEGGKKR